MESNSYFLFGNLRGKSTDSIAWSLFLLFSPQLKDQVSGKNCLPDGNVIASAQTTEGLNLVLMAGNVTNFQVSGAIQ